jgi:hypothetical protein
MRQVKNWGLVAGVVAGLMVAASAPAQRMDRAEDYQKKLQSTVDAKVQDWMAEYSEASGEKIKKADRWKCEVRLNESADYKDKWDVEISLTMPSKEFKEYAPIVALEAVAVPHNFPAAVLFIRETQTRKVAEIAFRKADPIGGGYRTGKDKAVQKAIDEMASALTWH